MGNCSKYSKRETCSKTYATCVEYEGNLSDYTELDIDSCHDVEEVIEDLTTILDGVKDELNLEALVGECITYPAGEKKLIDYLSSMQDFICNQNEAIITMQAQIVTLQEQVQELQENNCP